MSAIAPFLALLATLILGVGCSAAASVIAANPVPPSNNMGVPASTVVDRHPSNIKASVPSQALWIEMPFSSRRIDAPQRVDAGTTRTLRRGRVGRRIFSALPAQCGSRLFPAIPPYAPSRSGHRAVRLVVGAGQVEGFAATHAGVGHG